MSVRPGGPAAIAPLLALLARPDVATASELLTWRLEGGVIQADRADAPLPVGSLQKPFVAKAWARAHPGAEPPRVRCDPSSGCWLRGGHGGLGLSRAVAVSCNTYFLELARETPREVLEATLRGEGFVVEGGLTAEAAIGLEGDGAEVAIRPSALLTSYVRLTRLPWDSGEPVRRALLAGMREAALEGTAGGLARRGFWAKTGTVRAVDGRPLATSGWALAVDDSGWAILALLSHGTGREAARRLAGPLARLRPWSAPRATGGPATRRTSSDRGNPTATDGPVRVGLLDALRPRQVLARNGGLAPVATSRGYVGPGGALTLRPGDRLEEGLWELTVPDRRFRRRVQGALAAEAGPDGTLRLRAEVARADYVAGVLAAELPEGDPLRIELGAAVLRFLAGGPRHGALDVCDTTHCAWFVGRGPRAFWPARDRPVLVETAGEAERAEGGLDSATWSRILAASGEPGPSHWTSHCGGAGLSSHALWGTGDRRVVACPRHRGGERPWTRTWRDGDLARAFGARVFSLEVADVSGVWTLRVGAATGARELSYDEAHRALASVLGWAALPSPATRVVRVEEDFRAEGVGLGHRVGLCLGAGGSSERGSSER